MRSYVRLFDFDGKYEGLASVDVASDKTVLFWRGKTYLRQPVTPTSREYPLQEFRETRWAKDVTEPQVATGVGQMARVISAIEEQIAAERKIDDDCECGMRCICRVGRPADRTPELRELLAAAIRLDIPWEKLER